MGFFVCWILVTTGIVVLFFAVAPWVVGLLWRLNVWWLLEKVGDYCAWASKTASGGRM